MISQYTKRVRRAKAAVVGLPKSRLTDGFPVTFCHLLPPAIHGQGGPRILIVSLNAQSRAGEICRDVSHGLAVARRALQGSLGAL